MTSQPREPGAKPATPAKQLQELRSEFGKAARGLYTAESDEDRKKAADLGASLGPRCLELAEKNPKDPVALDALVQVISLELWLHNNTNHPGRGKDNLEARAVAQILRDHLPSDKLSDATWRSSYGFSKDCEKLLRTILKENPHRKIQGQACLRLAQLLHARLHKLELIEGKPDMARRYEGLFGKEHLDALKKQDRAKVMEEVEALFERAIKEYGDVKMQYDDVVGMRAKTELHAIRHLAVGKPAQDIDGTDQDGKRFKLSDYRGKVVLLYFWSDI
jgi:hypothetical protein